MNQPDKSVRDFFLFSLISTACGFGCYYLFGIVEAMDTSLLRSFGYAACLTTAVVTFFLGLTALGALAEVMPSKSALGVLMELGNVIGLGMRQIIGLFHINTLFNMVKKITHWLRTGWPSVVYKTIKEQRVSRALFVIFYIALTVSTIHLVVHSDFHRALPLWTIPVTMLGMFALGISCFLITFFSAFFIIGVDLCKEEENEEDPIEERHLKGMLFVLSPFFAVVGVLSGLLQAFAPKQDKTKQVSANSA